MAAIGEVLSSSIVDLVGESWPSGDRDGMPSFVKPKFGSYLRIDATEDDISIFAVVYNVVTGPSDSMHKPTALKMTREELKREQPHIFALLKTEIQAATVGYAAKNSVQSRLPPHPAQ